MSEVPLFTLFKYFMNANLNVVRGLDKNIFDPPLMTSPHHTRTLELDGAPPPQSTPPSIHFHTRSTPAFLHTGFVRVWSVDIFSYDSSCVGICEAESWPSTSPSKDLSKKDFCKLSTLNSISSCLVGVIFFFEPFLALLLSSEESIGFFFPL